MKKMFTLLLSLISFSALFAQYDKPYNDRRDNDRIAAYNDQRCNDNVDYNRPNRAVDMRTGDGRWGDYDRMSDRDSRSEIDRLNRDYDRRIDDYRNNRRIREWERQREIDRLKKEKAARLKNLGAGVLIGGVLGVLIGSQL